MTEVSKASLLKMATEAYNTGAIDALKALKEAMVKCIDDFVAIHEDKNRENK